MAHIKTYARLKPSKRAYPGYEICDNVLKIHIPDNKDFLVIDSQQAFRSSLSYEILFADIFRPEATQEDVFIIAAEEIIQGFLNGYNGTIFTYGQTGTGKTYTVEGNTSHYRTRGLSTRALSMIYQHLENRVDGHISVYISYLEIYQEIAYDLLNPSSRTSVPIIPFSKVTVFEGPQDSCILRGLSLHLAANEEIAQMFLLQGQANRKVAETPVNQRSSRSHAVFTVYLQVRKHDSKVVVNSKLHLVDLAGSERVSKTGVDGQQLTEAKSINLSLHHLETVIIALQTDIASSSGGEDRSRGDNPPSQRHSSSSTSVISSQSSDSVSRPCRFVPYRNSLLTMVLKDSLGGNCLTAMIATISLEPENLGESISTCRFAQRVARISNKARKNEVMDDKTLIRILKQKIILLKRKVAAFRAQGISTSPVVNCSKTLTTLSAKEKADCATIMEGFLQGVIVDPVRAGINDQTHFLECLCLLKQQCLISRTSHSQHLSEKQHEQQQQSVSPVLSSESTLELQPKEIECDHSDCSLSDAGTAVAVGMRRPLEITVSELSMDVSDECYSIKDIPNGSVISRVGSIGVSPKGCEISQSMKGYRADECMSYSDRARVKDIRRLVQDLTFLKPQVESQPSVHNMYMQRLQGTESSVRQRLKDLNAQLQEQCNYLLWLRNNRASSVQITKEHMVEQNLQKCLTKFEDKLNKLLEKKAKLNHCGSPDREISPCIRSTQTVLSQKHVQHKQDRESDIDNLGMEKLSPKIKPLAFKEVVTQDKLLKEQKLKARICQQLANHKLAANKGPFHSAADSVQLLAVSGAQSSGYAQRMENFEHCQVRTKSPAVSASIKSRSKEVSYSEASQSTEKQVKSIENCLIVDDVERKG